MSNQMRKAVFAGFILSSLSLATSVVVLIVSGAFLSVLSWLTIALSLVLSIILISLYIVAKQEERSLRGKVSYYKLVHMLREKALLDFYNRMGVTPQYDKDGKLLTPDELLGILTKLDAKGKLDDSVYEMLGIMPQFDKDGKEIPRIVVLKHLIKAIKKDKFDEISKLKGLHTKGDEKKAEGNKGKDKDKEKQKAPAKKEDSASGGKSKGGEGPNKINRFAGTIINPEIKLGGKPAVKQAEPKKPFADKAVETIKEIAKSENLAPEVEKPKMEASRVVPRRTMDRDSYLRRMWEEKAKESATPKPPVQEVQEQAVEEQGEATFE